MNQPNQHDILFAIKTADGLALRQDYATMRRWLRKAIELSEQHGHCRKTLRELPLGMRVQALDAQVWQVIKHEPEVRRVKLRLLTSENHQEWDAPDDTIVEWRVNGCCEIWTIVDTNCSGCAHHYPRNADWTCELELKPDTCGDRLDGPKQFTLADALRIMEAGGECEHWWEPANGWLKSRISDGKRQFQILGGKWSGTWMDDDESWESLIWRPYNPEAK